MSGRPNSDGDPTDVTECNGDVWVLSDSERAAAIASVYRCGHCDSDPATLRRLPDGNLTMVVEHDDGCPVLTGALTDEADLMRAAMGAGQ